MNSKRAIDLGLGSIAFVAALPILGAIAVAMRLSGDRGPFLYRARRVGEGGRLFDVLKIRTMVANTDGPKVTGLADARITRVGRFVRRVRLDELPQLVNVLRGQMSLVGPRPEDPAFVDLDIPIHRLVFTARPGITGLAQLEFHDEARLLSDADPERRYREEILPAKLRIDADYLQRQSVRLDLEIIARTVMTVAGRSERPPA
jgi:lipopolysaccharide/colanic/teichoic acid biosynthesis glycosyltransferase